MYGTLFYMTQEEALTILKTGANVFLTGEPGSGKTHTTNEYVSYLRSHGIEPAITASTGIAATHIGGMTIHAWSGIGIRTSISEYDIDKISQNERTVRRIKRASVLIIDEISMLSANAFSMVETVCRVLRGNEHPFGGLQIVAVGDFFQLPPIVRATDTEVATITFDEEATPRTHFAYESTAWKNLRPIVCYLTEQHRQADTAFVSILSALRSGTLNEDHKETLASRAYRGTVAPDVTQLFSHNADVDRINIVQLEKVAGNTKRFLMQQHGAPPLAAQLVRTCLSPSELLLKVGARVMFTKNDPQGAYVNGTTGIVVAFRTDSYPIVEIRSGAQIAAEPVEWSIENEGRVLASVTQIPLRLAWAITVHKSQGMSLDAALIDLSHAFEYGQGYVALSRVRSLEGLHLLGINKRALEVHPDIQTLDVTLRSQSEAAEEAFLQMDGPALQKLHTDFLKASGGTLEKTARTPLSPKVSTLEETKALISSSKSIEEIAKKRKLTPGTIISHLEQLSASKELTSAEITPLASKLTEAVRKDIRAAIARVGTEKLSPIHTALGGRYSFEDIRLARLLFEE